MAYCAYCGSHVAQVSFVPCASCGNPTNGSPPRPAIRKGSVSPMIGIVIALVLLVPFLGILAAIAIPNFLTAIERSKQKRTMADMRSLGSALEAYATEHRGYPQADNIDALRPQLTPKYMRQIPSVDGWAHPFRYATLENGYALVSAGKNGTFDEPPTGYTKGTTTQFDCDIVFSNGEFLLYPDVMGGGGH